MFLKRKPRGKTIMRMFIEEWKLFFEDAKAVR